MRRPACQAAHVPASQVHEALRTECGAHNVAGSVGAHNVAGSVGRLTEAEDQGRRCSGITSKGREPLRR
eukprot:358198-Chlamydomonas_euryale.AAC.6